MSRTRTCHAPAMQRVDKASSAPIVGATPSLRQPQILHTETLPRLATSSYNKMSIQMVPVSTVQATAIRRTVTTALTTASFQVTVDQGNPHRLGLHLARGFVRVTPLAAFLRTTPNQLGILDPAPALRKQQALHTTTPLRLATLSNGSHLPIQAVLGCNNNDCLLYTSPSPRD